MKTTIHNTQLSRRKFVHGMAVATTAAAVGARIPNALAEDEFISRNTEEFYSQQTLLSGTEFDLTIAEKRVNITGKTRIATLINGSLPAPTLVFREGDTVTLRVKNELDVDSSIHWHGIILPTHMDGVPGFSFDGIKPGETYTYQFTLQQTGTYWYHSHSEYQEQTGVYGAIVVLPRKSEPVHSDYDYVVQLSDWSDTAPETIYANLKKMGDFYNIGQRTVGDFFDEISQFGFSKAWENRKMWNTMKMTDRDISDVSGATYTYLMNGLSPNAHWRAQIEAGKKVRLRFINAAAMTFFDVRIPGLKMTVIAADGNLIQPVQVDEFRIGVAETYDVIIEPEAKQTAYAIFAQSIDRTGYAIGSLTTDTSQIAEAPEMDPLPILTMTDMGMDHSDMQGMDHSGHDMGSMNDTATDHSGHDMGSMSDNPMDSSGHNMETMNNNAIDHSGHDMSKSSYSSPDYRHALASEQMQMGMDVSDVDHSAHSHSAQAMNVDLDSIMMPMNMNPNLPQIEVPRKEGPQIDMRATGASYRLDDPGVGLRNNGRKVLTYADLKNLYPTRHEPKPTKELVLHLTGNMERYMWSIDGIPFDEAPPLKFQYGERIRITFINDTMMNHPMHLHGVWSDLETGDENHIPRKHTIVVQPGAKISYRVTMDARGDWAFHCHMLYHMMGMFRRVQIR
ncbi:copper resistance system multicopper oxidase [Thiomicrorhabdus sediminis]|uniref:Copper resistance system multicopper oxidase n=1 Tax=Thiomicrorhabdus sediminis TaxID=2580412 RepID=A0A4P9K4D8_9GAMM|nr:copper resistance system multicopper oxidase [Thiomicrorhabdus sediminis]QCU89792.1 copper resistance system multicopper oxidase [Thiomicrorhabdus sediminis]